MSLKGRDFKGLIWNSSSRFLLVVMAGNVHVVAAFDVGLFTEQAPWCWAGVLPGGSLRLLSRHASALCVARRLHTKRAR